MLLFDDVVQLCKMDISTPVLFLAASTIDSAIPASASCSPSLCYIVTRQEMGIAKKSDFVALRPLQLPRLRTIHALHDRLLQYLSIIYNACKMPGMKPLTSNQYVSKMQVS